MSYAALRTANLANQESLVQLGMARYRASHPRARRTAPTAIIHNGSNRTVYGCICGSQHSVATDWRDKTVHLQVWRAEHADCAENWLPLGLA